MKAKVIETGEIINVGYYTCPTYAVFDCNGKLKEIYDEDELEFEPCPKMVSLDKVCEWIKEHYLEFPHDDSSDAIKFINDLKKEFK